MDDNRIHHSDPASDRYVAPKPERDPSDCHRERVAAQDEWRMQHEQDRRVLNAMLVHGGSFAKGIAQAGFAADNDNLARLKAAFPELWATYQRMSEERR